MFPQQPEPHSPKFSCSLLQQNDSRWHLVMPKLWLLPWGWGVPKALCLCRTRDLSFDCLVFLLGCETEICSCLSCFLLVGDCSIIRLSLSEGSSAGLPLAQASYCCSAMKSEVPPALLSSSGQQQLLNSSAAKAHYHFYIIKRCCSSSSLDYHSNWWLFEGTATIGD